MWICPTHERSERLQNLINASERLTDVRVHILATGAGYDKVTLPNRWTLEYTEERSLAYKLNYALRLFPNVPFYGWIADDIIPLTANWDTKLSKAAGAWNIAFPNDCLRRESLCTHQCIGGALMREIGFWVPSGLQHNYMDNFWMTLGKTLNVLSYKPEVIWRHDHVTVNQELNDDTYAIAKASFYDDMAVWDSDEMTSLVEKTAHKIKQRWNKMELAAETQY